ncbi:hypothetical protein [Pseudonocardia nigra]|uniref:hypothetical protein n=1 Tax=Pseudonocardia nigra TaxID=1921578 RepID=UPI001C5DADDD|nr:hypothetical protein [Pseudonocardia nigra]
MSVVLTTARRGHPGLYWFAVACAGLAVAIAALAVVDQRTLLGAPLWVKPLKFAISFVAYAGALAWMLGQLRAPALRRTGWLIMVTSVIELVIITGQAARGVRSHFNDDDATGATLYTIMGVTVVVLYLATIAVALRFLREPGRDRVMGTAIGLGLAVGIVGMSVGFVMSGLDAHAVGVADGGPGLPFVGWSTTGGDLRIAHFVGMHAVQVLPLLAAALGRRLDGTGRRQVVLVAAAGYLGLVVLLTWQALRAQPLLAPDGGTLLALAALVLGTGAALHAVTRAAARRAALVTV